MRLALVFFAALGGCYNPTINEGDFACGPAPDRICPAGYGCGQNRRCFLLNGSHDLAVGPFRGGGELGDKNLSGQTGTLVIDTMTGAMTLGGTVVVPAGVAGFQIIEQTNAPRVAVWSFNSLNIPTNMIVRPAVNGYAVPVLAAVDSMVMNGSVDCIGFGGPGGGPNMQGKNRGTDGTNGGGPGSNGGGGGGGGYATMGKSGGSGASGQGGSGGTIFGNAEILPVQTGAGGGGGGGAMGGLGGTGGGAFVLFAKRLDLGGNIDCGGQGGFSATGMTSGGGGGGSGGSIMISAETLQYGASHTLRALGGKGATAVGTGGVGGDGGEGRIWIGALNPPTGTVNPMPTPQILMGERGIISDFPR